ncbi:surf-like protein [Lodderomyces elongisporus]|uniref:surf-like protein n=1 Tax=Lodderomyces elongisporus TaxID=36914 RepID=UPI00292126F4|nr:surf-like protein [Lodderomyces elongisporus]WLF76650.1 surf-like protein [Lodderomyces elongisporus]
MFSLSTTVTGQMLRMRFGSLLRCSRRTVKTSPTDWEPVTSVPGNLRTIAHQAKMPFIRKALLSLMLAMPIVSFCLGCWQVKRLKWKTDLIAKCENNLAAPVIEKIPPNLDVDVISKEFEYRRFKCKGHFDYDQEMFLGPRLKDGVVGYLVVTPFIRSDGGEPILIERGWIHKDKVVPGTRSKGYLSHLAFPQGEIEIEALFRNMPEKSKMQFDHEPGMKLFNVIDVPAMAKQSGSLPVYCQMIYDLNDHLEYKKGNENGTNNGDGKPHSKFWNALFSSGKSESVRDQEFIAQHQADHDETFQYQEFQFIQEGVPIAARPTIKLSNNHLQYLITWFGVSAASTGLFLWYLWRSKNYQSAEKMIAKKRQEMKKFY